MRSSTFRAIAVVIGTMLPAGGVFAGGSAIIENQSEGMMGAGTETVRTTLEWRDAETLRLEMQGESGYLLVRDGKAYSVMEEDGTLRVIDLGSMMKMMQAGNKKKGDAFGSVDSVEALGTTREVAGLEGSLYQVTSTDSSGETSVDTWVLSGEPLAREMTEAFHGAAMTMVGTADGDALFAQLKDALPEGMTGILEAGERYRVITVSSDTVPDARFELPAPPMDMGAFMEN